MTDGDCIDERGHRDERSRSTHGRCARFSRPGHAQPVSVRHWSIWQPLIRRHIFASHCPHCTFAQAHAQAHVSINMTCSDAWLQAGMRDLDTNVIPMGCSENKETTVALVSHHCRTRVGQPALLRKTEARSMLQRLHRFSRGHQQVPGLTCVARCDAARHRNGRRSFFWRTFGIVRARPPRGAVCIHNPYPIYITYDSYLLRLGSFEPGDKTGLRLSPT